MATDAFLKIKTIPGESSDAKHPDEIEVLSFSWGVSQQATVSGSTGGARTKGRSDHQDLHITKTLDKASPKLFLACCNGEHIAEMTLTLLRQTGKEKQPYMKYLMTDVLVSSFAGSGASDGDSAEQASFNYGKIELIYTATDHKTGAAKGDVKAHWSVIENKGG